MIKLRYFSTCYLILTFLVVLFILNAQMEDKGFLLFHREMLFLYFLCPIVSFISLIWFDVKTINNFSLSMKDSLISMTFTLLYGITLTILNITKVYTGPYPFFEVYKNPPIMSVVWFIVIIFGAFLISLAIKELINSITWTKWVRKRHKIITTIAFFILYPIVKKKYGINIERCKDKRQFMILLNHQTVFDQFFVGMTFRRAIYYLATEDIFSNGFSSKLIEYAVAPIPIKKSTSDLQAVKTILRVAKEGGTIAIAPEGNRTYSGKTIFMKPSITRLVKIAKLPLVLYHIEGGYGIQPRWSDDIRKGKMTSRIYKIIEPEEYMKLSDDELYKLIVDGLMVDETLIKDEYYSKTNAEYMERVIYYCPRCGLSSFISKGDTIKCEHCALEVKYLPNKTFISQEKEYNFPYENVNEWYEAQNDYINENKYKNDNGYSEDKYLYNDLICLKKVIPYKKKKLLFKELNLQLYENKLIFIQNGNEEMVLSYDEILSMAALGRNKLNIYVNNNIYQVTGDKHFNPVKYLNFYYHYRNIRLNKGENETYGKFLGL